MQKKAYRVLEEMCGGEKDECRSFVVANLETLKIALLETLKNASSPAKRVRLLCANISYFTILQCCLTASFCLCFRLASIEVSDPHSEKTEWRTQGLHYYLAARGANKHTHTQTRTYTGYWNLLFWLCSLCQVIICTKEVSVGARKNAYNLLVEMGKAFIRFYDNKKGMTHLW